MSAVDDVPARIHHLQQTLTTKTAKLHQLQRDLRYNIVTGVDERLDNGQSVACLEVQVQAGRNMRFNSGLFAGERTYVRVAVEVIMAVNSGEELRNTSVTEQKLTSKRPVGCTPRWNETLLFEGLPAAVGTLRLDVMQEEKIGADVLVGTFLLPLTRLQDQRLMEKWHVLKKFDKAIMSELFVSCRFQRSPISALELELELLNNQANELQLFLGRHQNLVFSPLESRNLGYKPLQGKNLSEETQASLRLSTVASFPPSLRKRESVENMSMNVEMYQAPRVKRQRVVEQKQVSSLSNRIVNWFTPATKSVSTAPTGIFGNLNPEIGSNETFPFTQRKVARDKRTRRTSQSVSTSSQKTPSALQAIEKWLFTAKHGNSRGLPFGRQD